MIEILKLTGLAAAAVLALVLFLYASPFGACGCGRRSCRRCRGLGRYQRRGSRTVHRLALAIRAEIERTRAERHSSPEEHR